jgi:hydroxymethylbilane synthase
MGAIAFLDDPATRFAVTAERAALAALGGGCQVPIGIHCRVAPQDEAGEWQEIFAVVADPANGNAVRIHHESRRSEIGPVALGQLAAEMLLEAGAGPLLEASSHPPTGASA